RTAPAMITKLASTASARPTTRPASHRVTAKAFHPRRIEGRLPRSNCGQRGYVWIFAVRCHHGDDKHEPRETPSFRHPRLQGVLMNESHFIRNALLALVGIVVVGWLAIFLIHALFGLIVYVLVGAVIVGGVYYLVRKSRPLGGNKRNQLRR